MLGRAGNLFPRTFLTYRAEGARAKFTLVSYAPQALAHVHFLLRGGLDCLHDVQATVLKRIVP